MNETSGFRPLLDAWDSHVAVLDDNGVIVEVNAAWRRVAEQNGLRTAQHALGSNCLEVCTSAEGSYSHGAIQVAQGLERVLAGTQESFAFEYPCHGPSERRWFRLQAAPLAAEPHGCVVAHQNITPYRLRALELQHARMDALQHAMGGVAHRYNNLLQVVLGFGVLLQDTPSLGAAESQDALREIVGAAERGGELGAKLIAYCGRETTDPRRLDLNRIAQQAHQRFQPLAPSGVQLQLRLSPDCHSAPADEAQIRRALDELIDNALHAVSGRGTVTLSTETRNADFRDWEHHPALAAGEYVVLSVEDSGAGMRPEVLERSREPFFTAWGAGSGSGLGLSVAYGLVRQNGGHLVLQSYPGVGSRCEILLPRR